MDKIENGVSTQSAAGPASSHAETAQERIRELQQWREQIPRFVTPAAAGATRRLTSVASIPAVFIELTNVALANHMPLVRTEGATPAQIRDLVAYAEAYAPLADELEALAQFIRYSAATARNAAGSEALMTYALAGRLAKLPATAYLAPYVADMRRALGRGRKPSPEALAQKAADRAAKAAARVARKALPVPTPQE
jgi:hypothetical protein